MGLILIGCPLLINHSLNSFVMLFRDAKIGQTIYVLNRTDMSLVEAKCTNVSIPHLDTYGGSPNKMVVDVTLDYGNGTQRTYVTSDGAEIAYSADQILVTDKRSLISEIESIKSASEKTIADIDKHKAIVEKASKLLIEVNPAEKEKQEYEQRFSNIESMLQQLLKQTKL